MSSSNTIAQLDNPNSPYFVHQADNHASMVVTPILTTLNYTSWSRSFLLAHSIWNKLGFIDGTIVCPPRNDPMYSAWMRCNDLIVAWILKSISPNIASQVFFFTAVMQIWNVLKRRFSQPDDIKICRLQQQLCVIIQGTRSVDTYFGELNTIWEELKVFRPLPHCSCGTCNDACFERFASLQQKDYLFKFLNGLNDSFNTTRSQIIAMRPLPSLDEAYSLVLQEESHHQPSNSVINPENDAMAMFVRRAPGPKRSSPDIVCNYCKKPGHC